MNPTVQLIQLTVKFERQEKAERHTPMATGDEFTQAQSGHLHKLTNLVQHILNPPRHQHYCECA